MKTILIGVCITISMGIAQHAGSGAQMIWSARA